MRVESSSEIVTHTERTGNRFGENPPKTWSNRITTRHFERDDIRKNPKDSSGFRRPSPYKGSLVEYDPPSVERRIRYLDSTQQWVEVDGVALSFSQIFGNVIGGPLDWENSLKQQALRSVKDQRVNLSMTLAFLPQTLSMIRGRFSTIGSVLQSAQRRDWQNVGRLLKVNPKSTASFYLEVLFGWLQLLRDTQGIVEELHRKCNKPHQTYVYGRAKRSQDIAPIVLVKQPYHNAAAPGDYVFQGDRKIDHNLVMIYRGETALLSRLSQLGLTNPLELLWDLVPWSWVVNMGTSIGDFISTLDATIGLTYLGGSYTQFTRCAGPVTVVEPWMRPCSSYCWAPDSFTSSPGFYSEMKFVRRTIDDKIDPFVLKNPFGSPIALTAAVIAAVVQKGRKATPQPPKGSTRYVYRPRRTRNLPPVTYRP